MAEETTTTPPSSHESAKVQGRSSCLCSLRSLMNKRRSCFKIVAFLLYSVSLFAGGALGHAMLIGRTNLSTEEEHRHWRRTPVAIRRPRLCDRGRRSSAKTPHIPSGIDEDSRVLSVTTPREFHNVYKKSVNGAFRISTAVLKIGYEASKAMFFGFVNSRVLDLAVSVAEGVLELYALIEEDLEAMSAEISELVDSLKQEMAGELVDGNLNIHLVDGNSQVVYVEYFDELRVIGDLKDDYDEYQNVAIFPKRNAYKYDGPVTIRLKAKIKSGDRAKLVLGGPQEWRVSTTFGKDCDTESVANGGEQLRCWLLAM